MINLQEYNKLSLEEKQRIREDLERKLLYVSGIAKESIELTLNKLRGYE